MVWRPVTRTWWLSAFLLALAPCACAEVTVVDTSPANGAKNVDPTTRVVRIRFSEPVATNRYSIVSTGLGRPLPVEGPLTFEEDGLVCVASVKLRPGTTYAFGVNSERFRNFVSAAAPHTPVTPYLVVFSTSGSSDLTPAAWREDLAHLARTLPERHKNLFFHQSKEEFERRVAELDRQLPALRDDQTIVGLMRLVASVGDGHTWVAGEELLPSPPLPLQFYWFREGLVVVDADGAHREALGCRLQRLGGAETEQVCETLSGVIPHENEAKVRSALPHYLAAPRVLHALGLIPDVKVVELDLVTPEGKPLHLSVAPALPDAKTVSVLDGVKPLPLYLQRMGAAYWVDYLAPEKCIYLQYNSCRENPRYPIARLQAGLEGLLADHPEARLVIDLRHNGGGNSALFDPLIAALAKRHEFSKPGRLFVIIGRATFSSAVLNAISLRDQAKAVLVGEPTGGKPNHYGEVKTFTLPNSGLAVSYSTKYFTYSQTDSPSLLPDVPAELTYADFAAGVDSALQAILKYSPPK